MKEIPVQKLLILTNPLFHENSRNLFDAFFFITNDSTEFFSFFFFFFSAFFLISCSVSA